MIRLVYSNRTEELAAALAEDVARLPAARRIFEPTPLVVPNPRVEAYVKRELARRNGVMVGLGTKYLRGFLADVAAATAPEVVLIDRALIQGELLALFHDDRALADAGADADAGEVRDYLRAGGEAEDAVDLRRYQLSAELAALYDEYAFSRPEMLAAWSDGRLVEGPELATQRWQRRLWLALHGGGGAFEARGRAEGRTYLSAPAFFDAHAARGALRAPPVAHVFGISYVARLYRRIFAALGRSCELAIYVLNPCREFWEDLETGGRRGRAAERARFPARRAGQQLSLLGDGNGGAGAGAAAPGAGADGSGADGDAAAGDTPALALWGRPGRENIQLLQQLTDCDFAARFADPLEGAAAPTLLAQLQRDILDRVPARTGGARLRLADDSIRILPCPDPRRELETIAAEIWSLLGRETAATGAPPLRLSDIALIVPPAAAETYLPLASAVLREASDLPHAIVDAAPGGAGHLLEAIGLLLSLPLGPLGRQDLLRLCAHPAVARRFPEADPEDWLALCEALDIVHGADRDDHAGTYVDGDRFNWDQGLRRLALGAFLSGRRSGEARPFSLGGDAYLPAELPPELQASAQGLSILARSLIAFARAARGARRPLAAWMGVVRHAVATTILPGDADDEGVLARVFGELQRLETITAPELAVGYRVAHELVVAALASLPARGHGHATHGITVSTFLPMRAIPFRAVFMAGMSEGRFPAADRMGTLDLRAGKRLPGDVSAREQDQYVFLETLLQARERLTISYVDRDAVTGEEMRPCSTVLELAELLEAGYLDDHDAAGAGARALARPAPPPRRHQDPAACAVIPAAARERRAAALGEAMRAAVGGQTLPDWPALRATLAPEALAALTPALGWAAPPAAPAAAARASAAPEPRRVLTLAQLVRFLQCPLQGSARVHLALGDDDAAGDEAEAAYREHEDFEAARPQAFPLLQRVLLETLGAEAGAGPAALERGYDEAAALAVLEGSLPSGSFFAAARQQHLSLLAGWAAMLTAAGRMSGRPAPLWLGHAPEHARDVEIRAPLLLDVPLPDQRVVRVEIHGGTQPVVELDGVTTSIGLLASASKRNGNGRDLLRVWIDHAVLAAAGHTGAGQTRRVLMLRPAQRVPEADELAPLDPEQARGYLTRLVGELLAGVHPYLLPCEAVLGWRNARARKPDLRLTDYLYALKEDDWSRFSSDWGPIPAPRDYPMPTEDDARAAVTRRLGPFFEAKREGGER